MPSLPGTCNAGTRSLFSLLFADDSTPAPDARAPLERDFLLPPSLTGVQRLLTIPRSFEPTQGGKAVRRDFAEAVATRAIRSTRHLPFVRADPRSSARAPVSLEKVMIEAIAVILVTM